MLPFSGFQGAQGGGPHTRHSQPLRSAHKKWSSINSQLFNLVILEMSFSGKFLGRGGLGRGGLGPSN